MYLSGAKDTWRGGNDCPRCNYDPHIWSSADNCCAAPALVSQSQWNGLCLFAVCRSVCLCRIGCGSSAHFFYSPCSVLPYFEDKRLLLQGFVLQNLSHPAADHPAASDRTTLHRRFSGAGLSIATNVIYSAIAANTVRPYGRRRCYRAGRRQVIMLTSESHDTSNGGKERIVARRKAARRSLSLAIIATSQIGGIGANCAEFTGAIEIIKRSIAPVVCMNIENHEVTGIRAINGSAFFISETGSFLTAAHIITDFISNPALSSCQVPAIYVPEHDSWNKPPQRLDWHRFVPQNCIINLRADLAQCQTVDDLSKPTNAFHPKPLIINAATQKDGASVAVSGFLLSNAFPLTSIGIVSGYTLENEISKIIIGKALWPGASGSPVYTENGEVVGLILSRGEGDGAGISIAASGETVMQWSRTTKLIEVEDHRSHLHADTREGDARAQARGESAGR